MINNNKGFEPQDIKEFSANLPSGQSFLIPDPENRSEDYVEFQFIGKYEGKDVIFDAALYSLRLQHSSEVYEMAEEMARKKFPAYNFESESTEEITDEDEEVGLYIAESIMEIEDEESVKVQEHVEIDLDGDFGVKLDVGLNVDEITDETIEKFIKEFNSETLTLDENMYSFQSEDEDFEDESMN